MDIRQQFADLLWPTGQGLLRKPVREPDYFVPSAV